MLLRITLIAPNISIPNTLGNKLKLKIFLMDYSRLFSLKYAMLSSMSTNSSDFQVTGCCLVAFTFVWGYSIGEMRKCVNYDLRRTSIPPPRLPCENEKGSNILETIYIGQWVQSLHDFPWICRMATRTLYTVRWGSNNWIRFQYHIYFW